VDPNSGTPGPYVRKSGTGDPDGGSANDRRPVCRLTNPGRQIEHRILVFAPAAGRRFADLLAIAPDGYLYYYPNNSHSNPGGAPFTNATWKSPEPTWGSARLA
jgi:hypothetical protein